MTFFADLTPHSYSPTGSLQALNVGWLDNGNTFSTGPTSQQFQDALLELCQHPIILHRGVHACCYCHSGDRNFGNGQIRVFGQNEIWYSAPTLIHHYVARHSYCPPSDFVAAVLAPVAVGTDYGWYP